MKVIYCLNVTSCGTGISR